MRGQASPQPIVTTTSGHSTSACSSRCGTRSARSTPSSHMAATTSGWTCSAGWVPADRASWRPFAAAVKSASAICERPAFWTQTKRIHAVAAALEEEHVPPLAVQLAEALSPPDDLEADAFVQANARVVLREHA